MSSRNANLCVLCCCSYGQPQQRVNDAGGVDNIISVDENTAIPDTGNITENPNFALFCKEIEILSKDNLNLTQTNQNFSSDLLLNSLEFFKRLSVCPECLSFISKACEVRTKANEREAIIRKLQLQILAELKELQKEVVGFHEEMMNIERVITCSDVTCLENFLEEFMPPRIEGLELGDQKGHVHKASVITFRNNILAVINEIKSFQERLTSQLDCTYTPTKKTPKKRKRPKRVKPERSTSDHHGDIEINPMELVEVKTELTELGIHLQDEDLTMNPDDPMSGRNSGARYGLRKSAKFSLPEVDMNLEEEGVGQEEGGFDIMGFFGDIQDDTNDVDFDETDYGGASGEASSEDSSEDSLSDNEYQPEEDPFSTKKSKKKKGKKSREDKSESTENKPKKKKWKKKKKVVPIPESVNFDKQSEFRRTIIQRVYRRLEKHRKKPPPSRPKDSKKIDPDIDPRLGYIMEYNPERKCLFVDSVEVRFNDDYEVLQCTACPFKIAQNEAKFHRSVDTIMFHHILGKHLEVYKCGECSQVLGSLKRWQDHIRGHQMQFVCDVCGKPMYSAESLYNHRWSHMNEAEMEEAIAKGMRDPRDKLNRMKERGAMRAFICQVCGKGFQTNFLLKSHEQIHREDRERIQCPKCGKTFLPMGFYSHQKYTCRPDGAPIVYQPCHLCPGKFFKNKHLLKRHYDRTHSALAETRPHLCQLCGRGFKTRGELGRHGNAHLETRPWVCSKGCGAGFKHKKNCTRHEGNCNGVGSSRGKPTTPATTTSSNSKSMFML